MLTLYRRHSKDCGRQDRYWKRCSCAMWVEGTLDRQYMRKSLHTQSWERAKGIVEQWETTGAPAAKPDVSTIEAAAKDYLADCRDRNLANISIQTYTKHLARFTGWCAANNYATTDELTTQAMRQWFADHPDFSSTTRYIERMRFSAFFYFCIRQKWISDNPMKGLGKLKKKAMPTDYVTATEMPLLLSAIKHEDTLALTLLMRWSGLRITDAMSLERARIDREGVLFLYQSKTNTPVSVPLPKVCLDALSKLPHRSPRYFLKPDENPYIAGVKHRKRIAQAAKEAGLAKHIHPHMMRDTFAIELLLSGAPLDLVSKLLGHASIKTTEESYAPWVKARQEQLNAAVRLAWG